MRLTLTVFAAALCLCGSASAQNENNMRGYGAVLDNIDLLIDHYTGFLARKYELTDEQDRYTRQMLRDRAHGFLDQNEDHLRELIDELFDARAGGEMSPQQLLDWGDRARPLYEEAKKLIVAGNEDWREILTSEQKEIHDGDLELMYESFATTEDQLERIASGDMTVDEFRNPRRHARSTRRATARAQPANEDILPPPAKPAQIAREDVAMSPAERRRAMRENAGARNPDAKTDARARPGSPRRRQFDPTPPGELETPGPEEPPRPARGATRDAEPDEQPGDRPDRPNRRDAQRRGSPRSTATGFEGEWDKYVNDFINKYNLDDAQQQQANSILDDCKKQANRYIQGRKGTMERLDEQIAELNASRGDPSDREAAKKRSEQVAALNKQKEEMREPIGRIFEKQLKPRLERIPTRAQRRTAEAESAKKKGRRGKSDRP